jgi:hypothetical protein
MGRFKRVNDAVGEAVPESGEDVAELLRRLLADDKRATLMSIALQAAADVEDGRKCVTGQAVSSFEVDSGSSTRAGSGSLPVQSRQPQRGWRRWLPPRRQQQWGPRRRRVVHQARTSRNRRKGHRRTHQLQGRPGRRRRHHPPSSHPCWNRKSGHTRRGLRPVGISTNQGVDGDVRQDAVEERADELATERAGQSTAAGTAQSTETHGGEQTAAGAATGLAISVHAAQRGIGDGTGQSRATDDTHTGGQRGATGTARQVSITAPPDSERSGIRSLAEHGPRTVLALRAGRQEPSTPRKTE